MLLVTLMVALLILVAYFLPAHADHPAHFEDHPCTAT